MASSPARSSQQQQQPPQQSQYCLTFEDVQKAATRIDGIAVRTPVLTSLAMNRTVSYDGSQSFFFKVEAFQHTGSFKFRGALNSIKTLLSQIPSAEKAASADVPVQFAVVTHSSGNHAQAVALAAKLASTPQVQVTATICMPLSTPLVKKSAVKELGADIVMTENTNEAREEAAERIVTETGAAFVHPSENPLVIAGQGTVCLEFVQQTKEMNVTLDVVVIPVGGGGLASGNLITLRALMGDKVKIVLAEPQNLDDAQRSFQAGELLKHRPDNKLDSVADGLKTTLGPNTWPIVRDCADSIFTVSEDDILRATMVVWERLKVCIEPSAGVGVAVAMSDAFQQKYGADNGIRNVGIVLCGGNVDILNIAKRMESSMRD